MIGRKSQLKGIINQCSNGCVVLLFGLSPVYFYSANTILGKSPLKILCTLSPNLIGFGFASARFPRISRLGR